MALTYCAQVGCLVLVPRGRCPAHARPAFGGKERPSRHARGYGADYQRARANVLKRDPICTLCRKAPSTQADHIIPGGGNAESNLRGTCADCNHKRGSALGGSR